MKIRFGTPFLDSLGAKQMGLPGYGLLIGRIIGAREPRRGNPHFLLMVQPGNPDHPPYRIAVNLQSTEHGHPAEAQYQIVNFNSRTSRAGNSLIQKLGRLGATPSFLVADSDPEIP